MLLVLRLPLATLFTTIVIVLQDIRRPISLERLVPPIHLVDPNLSFSLCVDSVCCCSEAVAKSREGEKERPRGRILLLAGLGALGFRLEIA